MIYILIFFISAGFLYLSRRTKHPFWRRFCVIAALFLPALLAGLRADTVGTDYQVYGLSFYEQAVSSESLLSFFSLQAYYGRQDFGYYFVLYLCSRISDSPMLGMFACQLITVSCIYLGLAKCEKRYGTPMWLGMLLYYLCLYNASLNVMRQCLAVSIAFFAFTFVWEKKYIHFLVGTAIAFTCHSSAVLGIAIFVMYIILQKGSEYNEKKQLFRAAIILAGILVLVFGLNMLVQLFVNMGVLSSNFLNYLAGGIYSNLGDSIGFSKTDLCIQLLYIFLLFFCYRCSNAREGEPLFFIMSSLLVLITSIFGTQIAQYLFRLSYYFIPFQMVGLANTSLCFKKQSKVLWICGIITVVFVTWVRLIVLANGHETMPYLFYWE